MKRLLLVALFILSSVCLVLGQADKYYGLGETAMNQKNYPQAIKYFNICLGEARSLVLIDSCEAKISECNRLLKEQQEKARREQEQRQQARREQEAIEAEQARREQEAIEAKQRRVVNEQGILYVYFPNGKSDLWADQKRDIKSYVETIGALHKDVLLEITTIENSAMGKAGGRLAQQRTDAVLDVIKSCGNYRIIERNLGGTEENDEKDIVTIIASWPTSGYENGHEWVDLGLSVKWATCNVGASSPGDYGNYYAWGEKYPKSDYNWKTYLFGDCHEVIRIRVSRGKVYDFVPGKGKGTKYITDSSCGTIDNRTCLERSDDASCANWGGSWRLPTESEYEELLNNCTQSWITQGGHIGYRFTSKRNGNSIFLPATGIRNGTTLEKAGTTGGYWSSFGHNAGACALYFDSSNVAVKGKWFFRFIGLAIRPVTE